MCTTVCCVKCYIIKLKKNAIEAIEARSTMYNNYKLSCFMSHGLFVKSRQEGIKCTKTKEYLAKSLLSHVYTVGCAIPR